MWKFRDIYSNEDNQDSNRLKNAIYMNIRFDEGDPLPPAEVDDAHFAQAAQATICTALLRALRAASSGVFMKFSENSA